MLTAFGAIAAVIFTGVHGDGIGNFHWSDALLFGAVLTAAFGYAEGGLLSRELGAWQTVSWALVLSAPLMAALTAYSVYQETPSAEPSQWASFLYLCVISMFLGFFAWYRGLAIGPMAQVSQIQLTQPVMSICWATIILGEPLTTMTIMGGLAVILCAASAVHVRIKNTTPSSPNEKK